MSAKTEQVDDVQVDTVVAGFGVAFVASLIRATS